MYCPECGKEIRDDSVFCYSCGSKIEIMIKKDTVTDTSPPETQNSKRETKNNQTNFNHGEEKKEKQDTIENTSPLVVNNETQTETKDINQTPLQKKNDRSWGWLILVCFYMGYILKTTNTNSLTSLLIKTSGLVITIVFYFWLKKFLPNKGLFKIKFTQGSNTTSLVSGLLSFYLIGMLVMGTAGYLEGSQKRKEINEFSKFFITRTEEYQKQDVEYSKMMMSIPKTESELKDKIFKIDEYKNLLTKKNKNSLVLVNFFREINSKYKNDKSVDEQINKLEKINMDIHKTSLDTMDVYKKYLITGDEKYFNIVQQEYERQQPLKDEMTKLITNIWKSL
jgi:hypothetical protein